ncbi:MAG: DUF7507 domain-containing protein, partial [Humibacter sp.]
WVEGDLVTYQFELTNTGNITETGVTISDPMPGLSAITYTWPGAAGVLAPGEEVDATATYHLTAGDVQHAKLTNAATAQSDQGAEAQDSVTLTDPPADPPASSSSSGQGGLADTGSDLGTPLLVAIALLGVGGVLTVLYAMRRRKRNS